MTCERYNIVKYTTAGKFVGIMAGCGRNASTWDSDHSRSAAYKYAAELRKSDPHHAYKVEAAS